MGRKKALSIPFTATDKKFAYELWYTMGKASVNQLQKELKRLYAMNKTPLATIPVISTIAEWKNEQNWEQMAKERDQIVEASLTNEAISIQNQVYGILSQLALQGLKAQSTIIEAAQLENLKPEQARLLLTQAGLLGKDAMEQFKQAMIIAGLGDQYNAETKKPLAEIIAWIDKTTGEGDKVKALLATKINE